MKKDGKMMPGRLIVLEGIDGSGKSTQFSLLTKRLEKEGQAFRKLSFPRYDNASSSLLKAYLNGEFGKDPGDVSAYAASSFFFVDRYASFKTDWGRYYRDGGLVLSDRYTTSNAIHQGAKLPENELDSFLDWLYDFEFSLMELPKPDAVIYMDIDLETSLAQMKRRQDETGASGDIHERDARYLESCLRAGDAACDRLGWRRISCLDKGAMRPVDDIHQELYSIVKGMI
jgi:dTMP kinase